MFDDRPVGFLTTLRPDGHLSTNPVAVMLRDGEVWVSTTKDRRKYRNLVADARVTVCVMDRNNPNRYVEVRGRAELVDDPDRVVIDELFRLLTGADRYPFDRPGQERVTIVVKAEQVSAPAIPMADDPPLAPDPA
ncbi:MAG: PPOX class F420-dependent oxidoreductase [Actinomycetes bacterium]